MRLPQQPQRCPAPAPSVHHDCEILGEIAERRGKLLGRDAEAIPGWLQGSNPHLSDRRPLDVLAEGATWPL